MLIQKNFKNIKKAAAAFRFSNRFSDGDNHMLVTADKKPVIVLSICNNMDSISKFCIFRNGEKN